MPTDQVPGHDIPLEIRVVLGRADDIKTLLGGKDVDADL